MENVWEAMTDNVSGLLWRKSSHSSLNGECVEVAAWRKSSRSSLQGECVELAAITTGIAIRDSKNPDDCRLHFRPGTWHAFTDRVKAGDYDV